MSKQRQTKTLSDIQADMSALYDQVVRGEIELNAAAELANIAGKFLKAEQLKLAREIFTTAIKQRSSVIELRPTDEKAS